MFFAYTFWLRRDTDMWMVPLCFSHQYALIDMQYDLFGATWVTTWHWPEVKFGSWPFKVKLCFFRRARTRETRWCKNHLPIFTKKIWKRTKKRTVFEKYHNFDLDDLWSLNHSPHLKSDEKMSPGLFQDYIWKSPSVYDALCRSNLSIMVFEMLTIIWRNMWILGIFDLWWPLMISILTLEKMTRIVSKKNFGRAIERFFVFCRCDGWEPS